MCLVEPSTYALEFSSMATVTAFSGASLAIAARPAMGSSRPDLVIVVRGLHPCSLYDSALDAAASLVRLLCLYLMCRCGWAPFMIRSSRLASALMWIAIATERSS